MLTVADVDSFLSLPKRAVQSIYWRPGLARVDAQWWKWDCAIEANGMVLEGARVIVQWRPPIGAAPDKSTFTLLYREERIYGIDSDIAGRHTNKIGKGRPYYRKIVNTAIHEHTWSADGYGYAEPLTSHLNSLTEIFDYFCLKANLMVEGGFRDPPSQQLSLGLI